MDSLQIPKPYNDLQMISVIVPFYNESSGVVPLYKKLSSVLEQIGMPWEILCINDGSQDQTLFELLDLHKKDPRVVVIDLSRNFGKESALTAGIDWAQGDVAIPLDADLQDPPEMIPVMISKWREGFDIVNAVRTSRKGDSLFKRLTAYLFYRVINRFSQVEIPKDVGDFRLISRPVLEAVKSLPERRRFMKGIFAWVGFRSVSIFYEREGRLKGKSKWNYWKLWNFALEGITSFSYIPLKVSSIVGFFVSLGAIGYGVFLLVRTLMFGNSVKGYPSLMVTVLFLGGVQMMALGVVGEYLGRTYEETKQRPRYIVRKVWRSE